MHPSVVGIVGLHQNGELCKFWRYEAFDDSVGNDILVYEKIADGT